MELQLDRKLSNKRIYPAVDIVSSSTRRDDLLQSPETLQRIWVLRNHLANMTTTEAMELIKDQMHLTKTNEEFLNLINQ
jgi:transcription termination factor Rho